MEAPSRHRLDYEQLSFIIYALAVLVALSVWFLAVRAPLWLDETGSYWSISGGFSQIWARSVEINSFPAYFYILWLTNAVFGGKEIVLRIPSILAMLAATYVFYRCARELFAREVALVATVLFILDGRVVFAAIDVRPYAFAMLITNVAIFSFIRWSKTKKVSYAALLGITSAGIFYFHYLFGCIVAAFVIAYFIDRWPSPFAELRQLGVAVGCLALLMVPVLSRLWYLQQTRSTHIFADPPTFTLFREALGFALPGSSPVASGVVPFVFLGAVFVAAFTRKVSIPDGPSIRRFILCAILGLVPSVILYGVSITTPLHVFINRYEAVAVPGIALCWAWIFSLIDSRLLRVLGCAVLVTWSAYLSYTSPMAGTHGYSWKDALEFADANAAQDGSPLVICSDLPESDFQSMPTGPASESLLFSPLGYYRVRATVVPMPRTLTEQAQVIGRRFLLRIDNKRFIAIGWIRSYPTLDWFASATSTTHVPHVLGEFLGIVVVEFVPRNASGQEPAPLPK
jgi:4-amino-4-deoxy-L-arabinose transferase-like glycosyltransferase